MSSWIKGPRCGIDNCKSRLWRSLDGRRVCRNGHVKEGEIEIGEDEDDFFGSQTIALRLPNSQRTQAAKLSALQNAGPSVLYGNEGFAVLMQSIQFLLRKQVQWLIDHQGLPEEFEKLAKALWTIVVNASKFAKVDLSVTTKSKETDRITKDGADTGDRDSDGDVSGGEEEVYEEQANGNSPPIGNIRLVDTVAICYLACAILRIPIYLYDLNRWIYRYQFPFMKGSQLLPDNMRSSLPPFYIASHLTPRAPPTLGQLHEASMELAKIFTNHKISIPSLNWKPLLFKIVHDLFMPPEIYLATELLVEKHLIYKFDMAPKQVRNRNGAPELLIMSAVLVCIKLCFGLDEKPRLPDGSDIATAAGYKYDWGVYSDMLRKVWIEDESFAEVDEREIMFWDSSKIHRYLDWFEENMIVDNESDVSRKRLLALFPVGRYDENGELIDGSERDSDVSPMADTVGEILKALQESTQLVDFGEQDEVSREPGQDYESYIRRAEPPPVIDHLFQAGARLCAVRPEVLAMSVRHTEMKLREIATGRQTGGQDREAVLRARQLYDIKGKWNTVKTVDEEVKKGGEETN